MMSKILKVNFDAFEYTISKYQESIDLFEETLNKLNKSIDILKTSGWDSAASEEFFNTFDNKWKYNMECIKSSQEDYKKLDELIQTTLKSLQL